jgi:hypothetical protein
VGWRNRANTDDQYGPLEVLQTQTAGMATAAAELAITTERGHERTETVKAPEPLRLRDSRAQ